MWPSEEWASRLYDSANILLIAALVVGAVATVVIVWMGNVKEAYLRTTIAKIDAGARIESARIESEAKKEIARVEGDAKRRISEVESEAGGKIAATMQLAGEADQKAAQLSRDAETLRKQNLDTETKLEAERRERLKLDAEIAPRRLTVDQQRAIATACHAFSGRRVLVVSYSMDGEAAVLATQLIAALTMGGIAVDNNVAGHMPLGGFSLGVHVTGSENDLVVGLRAILEAQGHLAVAAAQSSNSSAAMTTVVPSQVPAGATILVGVKPLTR